MLDWLEESVACERITLRERLPRRWSSSRMGASGLRRAARAELMPGGQVHFRIRTLARRLATALW
jgi:hypothetical protein